MAIVLQMVRLFNLKLRAGVKRPHAATVLAAVVLLAVAPFFVACGGPSGPPPPVPSILNINNSTDPSSPLGLPIEINGSGFQGAPGQVVFAQASSGITATVTPSSAGWNNSGIVVDVPSGVGTNLFSTPGTLKVTVVTSGGTSNPVTLTLEQTLTFDVNNVQWATTTPLPTPLQGLRAVTVPVNDTSAFVIVTGGFDGTANTADVFSNTLSTTGEVGPSWTIIPVTALPYPRAHHAMVEADPGNSLVSATSRYVYVIGGQENSTDAPGGTTTVYRAKIDTNVGSVGPWTQLSSSLPESLVGPAAAIFNGYVYLVGGLTSNDTPSANVYSAPVNPDGTLGTWSKSSNPYPMGVSFATAFGFAGNLYVLGGDDAASTNPDEQGNPGIKTVYFAKALDGVVQPWKLTSATNKNRKKQVTWNAFGQVIDAEGVYSGNPGSLELERTTVQANSSLGSWNGITATVNQINANVYNAAAVVSPLQSPTMTPRFILLGGEPFSSVLGGPPSAAVYYNYMP